MDGEEEIEERLDRNTHTHTQHDVYSYPRMLGIMVSLDIKMFSASYLYVSG